MTWSAGCRRPAGKKAIKKFRDSYVRLLWLIQIVLDDMPWHHWKPPFFDYNNHLVHAEKAAGDKLSDFDTANLSDLSILCECIHQIDMYQPWAYSFRITPSKEEQEDMESGFDGRMESVRQTYRALSQYPELSQMGDFFR